MRPNQRPRLSGAPLPSPLPELSHARASPSPSPMPATVTGGGGDGGTVAKTVVVPPVPVNSWYAAPFTEASNQPFSAFHMRHKGRVVFASKPIPVQPRDVDALPNHCPPTAQLFDLGKDLLYGVGYLHTTVLSTEHRWRGRVVHLANVKAGEDVVPETIRKAAELRQRERKVSANSAEYKATGREKEEDKAKETEARKGSTPVSPSAKSLKGGPEVAGGMNLSSVQGLLANSNSGFSNGIMNMARAEPTIYQHPFFDMLVGLKVFVNDELVADHYPGVKSLPQCTATIDTTDAVSNWNCMPFVLMGYLNHVTLDTIDLYRTLSLSFVDHLLHMKFPVLPSTTSAENGSITDTSRNHRSGSGSGRVPPIAVSPGTRVMEMRLRVEVVYGCRAEAFYCTDFVAKGSCTVFMAETAKPALKSYEEKLRALILAKRCSEQIIRVGPSRVEGTSRALVRGGAAAPMRVCQDCGNLLVFRCTVCGADFCGSLMCSRRPLPGYPCGCTAHKAMLS